MTHDSHTQDTWFSHANLHHTIKVLSPHFAAPLHCLRVQLGCFGYIQEWWKNLRLTNCIQVTCKSCDIRKSRCGSPNVPLNVSSCFLNACDPISPRWKYFRKVCSSRTIMKQKSRSRALRPKMSTASWGGERRGSDGGGGGEGRGRREGLEGGEKSCWTVQVATYLELLPQPQVDHLLWCSLVIPGTHLVNVAGRPSRDKNMATLTCRSHDFICKSHSPHI